MSRLIIEFFLLLGVYENEAVPQDYIDTNLPIAESQIVLGGYRLAYCMSYIFGSAGEEQQTSRDFADDLIFVIDAIYGL